MSSILHGRVHGRTIELDEDPGIAEGQEVEIQLKAVRHAKTWGEGIRRTAGTLADDPHWDNIMEEVQKARKVKRRPQGELH